MPVLRSALSTPNVLPSDMGIYVVDRKEDKIIMKFKIKEIIKRLRLYSLKTNISNGQGLKPFTKGLSVNIIKVTLQWVNQVRDMTLIASSYQDCLTL
jgi:hypothetical protein